MGAGAPAEPDLGYDGQHRCIGGAQVLMLEVGVGEATGTSGVVFGVLWQL